MGRVKVVYFAGARDAVEKKTEFLDTDGRSTVSAILERLVALHPGLRAMKQSIRLSVNHEVAAPEDSVRDGDEVGVLPPVAGG